MGRRKHKAQARRQGDSVPSNAVSVGRFRCENCGEPFDLWTEPENEDFGSVIFPCPICGVEAEVHA